jgi:hypothetical protein
MGTPEIDLSTCSIITGYKLKECHTTGLRFFCLDYPAIAVCGDGEIGNSFDHVFRRIITGYKLNECYCILLVTYVLLSRLSRDCSVL